MEFFGIAIQALLIATVPDHFVSVPCEVSLSVAGNSFVLKMPGKVGEPIRVRERQFNQERYTVGQPFQVDGYLFGHLMTVEAHYPSVPASKATAGRIQVISHQDPKYSSSEEIILRKGETARLSILAPRQMSEETMQMIADSLSQYATKSEMLGRMVIGLDNYFWKISALDFNKPQEPVRGSVLFNQISSFRIFSFDELEGFVGLDNIDRIRAALNADGIKVYEVGFEEKGEHRRGLMIDTFYQDFEHILRHLIWWRAEDDRQEDFY